MKQTRKILVTNQQHILRGCRIDIENRRIYLRATVRTDKSFKFYSTDETQRIESLLSNLGIKYLFDNDAPRGGKMGDYVTMNNTNFFRLLEWRKQKFY